ncbi:MAG: hypothetical protein U9N02_09025 [Campylobacterota bacterium]|nr:hypothetical protein [Campylobacterota bacterium]
MDGSERRSYTVSGIPEGTVVTVGSNSGTVASGTTEVTVNFSDNTDSDPVFTMKLPEQYSGNIDATIELKVTDLDSDSSHTPATNIETVYYKVGVNGAADNVTLSIVQPKGNEDAGRNADGSIDASSAENGIPIEIKAKSSDTDGSEHFNVTIDDIPDDASMYVYDTANTNWVIVNKDTANVGDLTIVDNGDATWKITIENYDVSDGTYTTNYPKFIPIHNSDEEAIALKISAVTIDGTDTQTVATTLDINVEVEAVADAQVGDTLNSIDRNSDATDDIYAVVLDENNSGTTTIDLEAIYDNISNLNSYDNTTNGGGEASETLFVVLSNLASDFSVSGVGATYLGGDGTSRKWVISKDDLDKVDITTPVSYSGEVDFQLTYITTEEDGDSKTSTPQDVKVLVKPVAEATIISSTDVKEDILTKVNLDISQDDSGEALQQVRILASDVDGEDFTLYTDNTTDNPIAGAVDGYYVLTASQADSLYVKYEANYGGAENQTNTFEVKYITTDTVTGLTDGVNSGNLVHTSSEATTTYTLNLEAVTDGIAIDVANKTKVSGANVTTTDNNDDNVSYTEEVTINATGTFTVDVDISALTDADTTNSVADISDSSESATRLVVAGVPDGISVTGGALASSGSTNLWFVDIADITLDSPTKTHQIEFQVHDELADSIGTENIVSIKIYNEDTNAENIESATTNLKFIDNIDNGSGGTDTIEANLVVSNYDVVEDTNFNLGDFITVTHDTSHTDAIYSVAIKNLTHVELVDETSMTSYTDANGDIVYVVSGDKDTIANKLSAIELKPESNFNQNNDASSELEIDVTLTAYKSSNPSVKSTANEIFSDTEVTPVTDVVTTSEVITTDAQNGTDTLEDGNYNINISLSTVDNPAVTFVQASDDATEASTIKVTHASGIAGTLSWGGASASSVDLAQGVTIIANVPADQINNLTFSPLADKSGSVVLTYDIYSKETNASNIETSQGTINITVKPVADGLTLSNLGGENNEGSMVSITHDGTSNIGQATMADVDGSETITALFIDGVPNGFVVKIDSGSGSGVVLAQNAGDNGSGANTWNIPVSGGDVPLVYIEAQEDWSGTLSDLNLKTYVNDDGSIVLKEQTFSVVINAAADVVTINPTKTFDSAYSWTEINLNANMTDLDGSETMNIVLSAKSGSDALDESALFRLVDTTAITDAVFDNGTWTISNIAYDEINNVEMLYHDYNGTIEVKAQTADRTDGANISDTSTFISTEEFALDITASNSIDLSGESRDLKITGTTSPDSITGGSGDDTVYVDGLDTVDGGLGDDIVSLVDGTSIDITKFTNIEQIDLTDGDHAINSITVAEIIALTDGDNDLIFLGNDFNDVVSLKDETDKTWTKDTNQVTENGHTFDVYTNSSDVTVSVKIEDQINDSII